MAYAMPCGMSMTATVSPAERSPDRSPRRYVLIQLGTGSFRIMGLLLRVAQVLLYHSTEPCLRDDPHDGPDRNAVLEERDRRDGADAVRTCSRRCVVDVELA